MYIYIFPELHFSDLTYVEQTTSHYLQLDLNKFKQSDQRVDFSYDHCSNNYYISQLTFFAEENYQETK